MSFTHIPPHSTDLEAAVLGIALVEAKALRTVLAILPSPEAFYVPKHQLIFRAVLELSRTGEAVDILTITQRLHAQGVLEKAGGAHFVASLTQRVNAATNLESHCRILQQQYIRRGVITESQRLLAHAYDENQDVLDLLTTTHTSLSKLAGTLTGRSVKTAASIYDEVFAELEVAVLNKGMTGVDTGLTELNDATGGWKPGTLIVIGARPAMGKTAAMLHFARTSALGSGLPSAIFSMEMGLKELLLRMVASEVNGYSNSDLTNARLKGGVEEVRHIKQKAERLRTDLLLLDETPSLSLMQLRTKCAELKAEHNIGLVMVDYLQLMAGEKRGGNREQEISSISRGLKEMSKELNVPVIALAQLSRSVEQRGGEKRPQISDLRESGAIEQDADIIIMLWRGEAYDIDEYADGTATAGTILLDIVKHRSGATGEVIAACELKRGLFSDLNPSPAPAGERDFYIGQGQTVKLGKLPASQFDEQATVNNQDPGF